MIKEPEKFDHIEDMDSIRPTFEDIDVASFKPAYQNKTRMALLAVLAATGLGAAGAVKAVSSDSRDENSPTVTAVSEMTGVQRESENIPQKVQTPQEPNIKNLLQKSLSAAKGGYWDTDDLNHRGFHHNMAEVYLIMCPHLILEYASENQVSDRIFSQAIRSLSKRPYAGFSDKPTRTQVGAILEKTMPRWINHENAKAVISNLLQYNPDLILYLIPAFKANGMNPSQLAVLASGAAKRDTAAAVELQDRYEENTLPGTIGRQIFSVARNNIPRH